MKIGVVTTSYPRTPGDHAGNFVAAQVAALRALGHDVDVISAHSLDDRIPSGGATLFGGAGAPDELERGGLRAYLAAARFSLAQTRAVAAALPAWDIAIAHWIAPSALAVALASLAARAMPAARATPCLVVVAHGGDIHTLRRLHLLAPALRLLRAVEARIVFVSSELRDIARASAPRLRAWLDETSIVQPMGIDVARFEAVRARRVAHRATSANDPIVLVVARLVPIKGVDIVIRALGQLRTRVRLVIAGDGPERGQLQELAREVEQQLAREATAREHVDAGRQAPGTSRVDLVDRVELVGRVDADARDAWLREAACVVVPSRVLPNGRSEGTPMIALEALAAGVPVVASDVGGLRDVPGLVRVRPDDPRALADAIDRVLAATAMGIGAEDATLFDHRQIAARVLALTGVDGDGAGAVGATDCEAGDSTSRRTA